MRLSRTSLAVLLAIGGLAGVSGACSDGAPDTDGSVAATATDGSVTATATDDPSDDREQDVDGIALELQQPMPLGGGTVILEEGEAEGQPITLAVEDADGVTADLTLDEPGDTGTVGALEITFVRRSDTGLPIVAASP